MVKEWAEKDGIELDEDYDLIQAIEEIDTQGQIQSAIRSALSDCEGDSYSNYLYNQLKDAVSELGIVSNWGDNNISIDIDLEEMVIEHTTWETYEEALERCGGELSCTFYEMISNGDIEKPKFDPDERFTPDVDDNLFNEILIDRLNEI
jgi:rubrerythrin